MGRYLIHRLIARLSAKHHHLKGFYEIALWSSKIFLSFSRRRLNYRRQVLKNIKDKLRSYMNDYIETMRKFIGHEVLLTVGCGAIIENKCGRILLQRRVDYDIWGIPGGILEIGETVEETVRREVFEETNLTLNSIELFGIYSGKNGYGQYANGDKVFSVQIIFYVKDFDGELKHRNEESRELKFLSRNEIPNNLNSHQAPFIMDWVNGRATPIIK